MEAGAAWDLRQGLISYEWTTLGHKREVSLPSALGFENVADLLADSQEMSVLIARRYQGNPNRHATFAFEAGYIDNRCVQRLRPN